MVHPYTRCGCIIGAIVSSLLSALLLSPILAIQRKGKRRGAIVGIVLTAPLLASSAVFADVVSYACVVILYGVSIIVFARRSGLEHLYPLPPTLLALYSVVVSLEYECLSG